MRKLNKITIIGVGLIGGSIGLAIRKKRLARQVAGVFRHRSTMKKALARKAIDKGFMTMAEGVADADLIILATPVHAIPVLVMEALRFAKKGAVITDAGSTKAWIVKTCERGLGRNGRVAFVGSHPMAGSEQTGVTYASAGLFEGSPCIVTKTPATDRRALRLVTRFWKALGTRVAVMSPAFVFP